MPQTKSRFEIEASVLNTLAHPIRLQILELLRDGEACVCHIQAALNQRQAYVSQHLMALREAGLVVCHKQGLRVYYQLSDPHILDILDDVQTVAHVENGRALVRHTAPLRGKCNCPQCREESQVKA